VSRPVILADEDGATATASALERTGGTAVWVGEESGPAYEEFAAELGRREGDQ
jgi:hypothetical protein